MPSISDLQLRAGCAKHVEHTHGEIVRVVSGVEAGKVYPGAVIEIEQDSILEAAMGEDPRAHRFVRFPESNHPTLESQDLVQTEDGKKWKTVRRPDAAYLSVDYELIELVTGKDT